MNKLLMVINLKKIILFLAMIIFLCSCKKDSLKDMMYEVKLPEIERIYSYYSVPSQEKKLKELANILGCPNQNLKLKNDSLNLYTTTSYLNDNSFDIFEFATIALYLNPELNEINIYETKSIPTVIKRSVVENLYKEFKEISPLNLESLMRSLSITSRSTVELELAKTQLDRSIKKHSPGTVDAQYKTISYKILGWVKEKNVYNFYVYLRYSAFTYEEMPIEIDAKEALIKIGIKAINMISFEEEKNVVVQERDLTEDIKNTTDLKTISDELKKENMINAMKFLENARKNPGKDI